MKAVLSNYLWIPKRAVKGTPSEFAPGWEYRIELLNTPDGRAMQQQIATLRELAPEDFDLADLTEDDHLLLKNWTSVGDKWWALCSGDLKKCRKLAKKLDLKITDRRVEVPWDDEVRENLDILMTPRPAQVPALEEWREAGHGILKAAPAFGKAQPVDEVVLTPGGWVPIGTLKVGDQVIGSDGNPCHVTGVYPQGQRPICTVRFSDGASTRADVDHLWAVKNSSDLRRGKPWRTLTTQQVRDSLLEPCGEAQWRVPTVSVQGEELDLPLDPYVLGVLIGDGCLAEYLPSPQFTTVDEEIVEFVNQRLPDGFRCVQTQDYSKNHRAPSYRISRGTGTFAKRNSEVKEALKTLGLWGCRSDSKFIPEEYLRASEEQRRLLLSGIMDTDGWTRGSQLSTASERLALDVVSLARSLGGTARLSQKATSYVYNGERREGQGAFMVTVKVPFTPFLLTRKREVYESKQRIKPCRKVTAVEDAGTAECVCISVSAPDKLYVTKDYVVTHNTFVMIKLIMELQQQTIVLVHTDALAEQFITRFRKGSPASDAEDETEFIPVTNCLEVEEKLGRPVIGRYRKPDELYPVTVATWQSFISAGGQKALKKVGKSFGLLLCDEAHVFAAPKAASVVNGFHAKRRSGATATPERKDKLDVALYDVVGPVTAHGRAGQMPITATMITTGTSYKGSKVARRGEWTYMLNFIMKQADRNDLIMEWVEHDVAQGRYLLLLADRVNWCLDTAEYIDKQLGIPAAAVTGGMSSKKGIAKRNEIIQRMTDGDLKVICATQVFKAGVDIPPLDTLYATCPMNNQPQLEQMLGRVRRFHDGKQTPTLRYFVDEGHGLLYGCARGTHKALVNLGADIILVPEGRKPGAVGGTTLVSDQDGKIKRRKKRGLRAAADRSPSGVSKLFSDLQKEARLTKDYNKRMGK